MSKSEQQRPLPAVKLDDEMLIPITETMLQLSDGRILKGGPQVLWVRKLGTVDNIGFEETAE